MLLPLGIAFHEGIAVFHSIISFVLIMFGALVLLLRPYQEMFRFEWIRSWLLRFLASESASAMESIPSVPRPS